MASPLRVYDGLDRLVGETRMDAATSVVSYGYSESHNLDLVWNGRYQLTDVRTNGVVAERYGYDPLGRRAWTFDGTATNWHMYDGAQVVADVDATGGLVRTYVWGPGIDNLLAMTVYGGTGASPSVFYAVKDHLGTVQALVNSDGAVVESYRFDVWGRVLGIFDSSGAPLATSHSPLGNRYLWQGRGFSWQTGLYYFRARWYDPVTGRWLSNDPIGINGGLNQYVFAGNDPVNNVDPFGTCDHDKSEVGKTLLIMRIIINSTRLIGYSNSWNLFDTMQGARMNIASFLMVGGPWTPLNKRFVPAGFYNIKDTWEVPGHGVMDTSSYGNYLAGYVAGYGSGVTGYIGVRLGGIFYASLVQGSFSTDSVSAPWIIAGFKDGKADCPFAKERGP